MHALLHAANIQDRDGGLRLAVILRTLARCKSESKGQTNTLCP